MPEATARYTQNDALSRAEAIRAIKRLQHAHSHYATSLQWEDVSRLFTKDGELIRGSEAIRGQPAIARYLVERHGSLKPGRLFAEFIMSPVVTLSADGLIGKGRWHELTVDVVAGERADWAGGIHENTYRLEDGIWKIACLHYHPQFAGPYNTGWRGLSDNPQLVPYHFSATDAGRPSTAGVATLTIDNPGAAERLAWLEDEAAIGSLQNAWGYYVDRRQWDDIADLYTSDGRILLVDGEIMGQQAIRSALDAAAPAGLADGELHDHLLFAPVITPHPDMAGASARGLMLVMTGQNHVEAQWSIAMYDNDYVKQDGVWMIAASRYYPFASTDYRRGWADSQLSNSPGWPFASNTSSARFPTSAPPAIRFSHPVRDKRYLPPEPTNVIAQDPVLRLERAASFDALENIACAYGYYIDEYRWHDVAKLFSEKGWKELSYIGTYVGRERVLGSLIARYGDLGRTTSFLAIHQKLQPVITTAHDARSARMHLRLFQVGAWPSGPGPFIGGVYEDEAVLEDGVWKISGMDLDYIWFSGYAEGWGRVDPAAARQFAPKPGAMDHYPPDGPLRGPMYSPFPEQEPLPFHFRNPVSGRSPTLLLG
jgi:hypothetical protein